jgi:hypothetical protein
MLLDGANDEEGADALDTGGESVEGGMSYTPMEHPSIDKNIRNYY